MSTATSNAAKLVEAQVIAAGVSYFSIEKVIGADGQPSKDAQGNEIAITVRHEAVHGDIVEMSQHEFDRNAALGAVREPSSAPLRGPLRATPFGIPIVDDTTGQPAAFAGPLMGDPRPAGADAPASDIARGLRPGALSPEQSEYLERAARGEVEGLSDYASLPGVDVDSQGRATPTVQEEQSGAGTTRADVEPLAHRPQGNDLNSDEFAMTEDTTSEQVLEHLDEKKPNVDETLALATVGDHVDKERAEVVLEAELARDNPREGVVKPLQKVVGE